MVKMGIMEKIIRVDGNSKAVRLGIKLKDFENTTEEYEECTSAEVSFADVNTDMSSPSSPIKKDDEVERLLLEKKRLLFKVKEQEETLTEREETLNEYRQRFAGYEEMRKAEPELIDWELREAQDNNRKLVALVRYFEGELGKGFLDADGKVLPEELK